jgi:general secretion pathway protein G
MYYVLMENANGLPAGKGDASMSRSSWCMSFCTRAVDHNSQGYSLVELLIVVAIFITIAAIAIPSYSGMIDRAHEVAAMGDIKQMQFEIECYFISAGIYPESLATVKLDDRLDPWGRPYQYFRIAGAAAGKGKGKGKSDGARKDKNLHPLNSDYDLYSKGHDGDSSLPLTAKQSRDDIIRANNGGFIGVASNY